MWNLYFYCTWTLRTYTCVKEHSEKTIIHNDCLNKHSFPCYSSFLWYLNPTYWDIQWYLLLMFRTNTSVTEVENTAKEQISQCSNWSIVFHVMVHYYDTCVFLIENPAYWDIQWWYLLLMFRTNTSVTENTAKEQISQLNVQIKS